MLSSSPDEKAITVFAANVGNRYPDFFLVYGENFYRLWDVTEYKELFIPLAFFIYSLSVYRQVNKTCLADNRSIPVDNLLRL